MENDSFRLIVRRGPQPNQVYELTSDITNLGRDITNDIVINDREVSRHHLRLTKGADGFTLEDLGSTNGTFVNGKRLTGTIALKNGDMVGLGETVTLQFENARAGASSPPPQQQQPQAQPPAQQQPVQSSPPPAGDEQRYQPPAQQQPVQPSPQQQPVQPPQQQPDPYQAPQQQPVQAYQNDYAPPQDYGNPQGGNVAASYGPPPPGYDYDPYAMREDEGSNRMQMIAFGCLGIVALCCCMTVVAAVLVDTLCLYEQVPLVPDILNALSIPINCPS